MAANQAPEGRALVVGLGRVCDMVLTSCRKTDLRALDAMSEADRATAATRIEMLHRQALEVVRMLPRKEPA